MNTVHTGDGTPYPPGAPNITDGQRTPHSNITSSSVASGILDNRPVQYEPQRTERHGQGTALALASRCTPVEEDHAHCAPCGFRRTRCNEHQRAASHVSGRIRHSRADTTDRHANRGAMHVHRHPARLVHSAPLQPSRHTRTRCHHRRGNHTRMPRRAARHFAATGLLRFHTGRDIARTLGGHRKDGSLRRERSLQFHARIATTRNDGTGHRHCYKLPCISQVGSDSGEITTNHFHGRTRGQYLSVGAHLHRATRIYPLFAQRNCIHLLNLFPHGSFQSGLVKLASTWSSHRPLIKR